MSSVVVHCKASMQDRNVDSSGSLNPVNPIRSVPELAGRPPPLVCLPPKIQCRIQDIPLLIRCIFGGSWSNQVWSSAVPVPSATRFCACGGGACPKPSRIPPQPSTSTFIWSPERSRKFGEQYTPILYIEIRTLAGAPVGFMAAARFAGKCWAKGGLSIASARCWALCASHSIVATRLPKQRAWSSLKVILGLPVSRPCCTTTVAEATSVVIDHPNDCAACRM
mmetsp:Transcript_34584/g.80881  ORF Transcript_34584/g.80881 Transcript_34584/m.80881 type:complete len:223 (+) Transcript_34584:606-1274(+)